MRTTVCPHSGRGAILGVRQAAENRYVFSSSETTILKSMASADVGCFSISCAAQRGCCSRDVSLCTSELSGLAALSIAGGERGVGGKVKGQGHHPTSWSRIKKGMLRRKSL